MSKRQQYGIGGFGAGQLSLVTHVHGAASIMQNPGEGTKSAHGSGGAEAPQPDDVHGSAYLQPHQHSTPCSVSTAFGTTGPPGDFFLRGGGASSVHGELLGSAEPRLASGGVHCGQSGAFGSGQLVAVCIEQRNVAIHHSSGVKSSPEPDVPLPLVDPDCVPDEVVPPLLPPLFPPGSHPLMTVIPSQHTDL